MGVVGAQPVRRRIVVIAIERIAAVGVAGLVAGVEIAGRSERAADQRQNLLKLLPGNVKQAGIGPNAVIGFDLVEVMEQQRPDGPAETARCLAGHFRRSIRRTGIKTFCQHFGRSSTRAASQFENGSPRRELGEKPRQPRMRRDLAAGIRLRVAAVELKGFLVHDRRSWRATYADVCSALIMYREPQCAGIQRTQQRPEMLLVDPPATGGGLVDRLAALRRARGTDRPLGLME